MINFLKKHKYKLLTLMLSIVSIFTLFLGINKTYAYETDTFSYTISNITTTNNNLNISNTNNIYTIRNNDANNYLVDLQLNLINSNTTENNITLLINYDLLVSNDNVTFTRKTISNTQTNSNSCKLSYNFISNGVSNMGKDTYINNTNAFFINDKNYFSNTMLLNKVNATDITFNAISLNMAYGVFNSASYWKLMIYNVDIVDQTQIGLSQYYETYYSQIENNYNQLQEDYNTLQDNYNILDTNYDTLQNSYDTLQSNYNQLNGNINNLNDFYKYGFLSLIKNGYNDNNNVQGSYLVISYVNRSTNVVNSIDYPITLNDISNYFGNSTLSLYDLVNYYKGVFDTNINSNNDYYIYSIDLNLYFQSSYGIDYLDFTNHDFNYEMELFIRDNVNNYSLYLTDLDNTNSHINSELILQKNSNLKMFDYIGFTYIVYNSDTLCPYISLNNVSSSYYQSGFDNGYQSGIQQGRNSQQSTINNLNEQVNNLNNQVNELEQSNLYQYNSGYQRGLNEGASQNLERDGMKTLFNSILSYPVNMIKSVFDFEFMGINISSLVMFIISIGIVAFVIKKFL